MIRVTLAAVVLALTANAQTPAAGTPPPAVKPAEKPAANAPAEAGKQPEAPKQEPKPAADPDAALGLVWETGKVKVQDYATIDLPQGWRYLQAAGARKVLEKVWGNPPDSSVLGLAFPPGAGPRHSEFAVVVSSENEGYVKDDDAATMDYGALLKDMQADTKEGNDERRAQHYPTVELLGWAEPPHYDAKEKKLYWAKRLRFDGSDEPELNYDVRILGRHGYLVLTALASDKNLAAVADGCKQLLGVTQFVEGKRYTDFDPAYDKVAAYGIGGLIAGKILLKAGLFAGLLKLLAALWKPIAVGLAVLGGSIAKLFGRKKAASATGGDDGNAAS